MGAGAVSELTESYFGEAFLIRSNSTSRTQEFNLKDLSLLFFLLFLYVTGASVVRADDENTTVPAQPNLVNAANAPLSSIMQVRLQDAYDPEFKGLNGSGNEFSIALTMPLPEYRLLPFPQLSLLTIPAAVTLPGGSTGFGDVRFVDVAVLKAWHNVVWGVGPALVFPTASKSVIGQGKWQAGPAAAVGFSSEKWLVGVLAENLFSFAGDHNRADVNELILQPFVSYQLGKGWFVRSEPQMLFDWKTDKQLLPLDVGVGRVFKIGRQDVSCFVEAFWNIKFDGPAPRYGITFGVTLLYPNFWGAN